MFGIKTRYVFVFLLGSYSFLNIKFTQGDAVLTQQIPNVFLYAIILLIVLAVWEGNRFIGILTDRFHHKKISHKLLKHFFISLLLVSVLTPIVNVSINLVLESPDLFNGFNQLLGFGFRINLFLHCINAIIVYNKALSTARIEAETLKKETTEAQFEALRKQINPHFLFNSFNVLSSIIESDPKLAVNFLEQLSKVYRYLLRTQDLKTVPLREELDFIASYIFLLRIRFGQNLRFEQKIGDDQNEIPPSTLQLLIENAIKHNEVSKEKPLNILLERSNGSLLVKNNRNPKQKKEASEQVGLANIKKRYQLLGSEPPMIDESDEEFVVKLSLIN
ncbi:MAG: histidine kinase [Bacteroidota bacterium]